MDEVDKTPSIRIERVYEDPQGRTGGFRVLVDRLWPRGESKAEFRYDLWAKDIAPSTQLREWFHADPESRWDEFARRYEAELEANPATAGLIDRLKGHDDVVLLYGSRDTVRNNAVIVARFLSKKL